MIQIQLPASKSISNRLLIMQALSKTNFKIQNLSKADDTVVLKEAIDSNLDIVDVGVAGTAFRFLTAFYAIQSNEVILKGDARMNERPIGALVDALVELGAEITYLDKTGFPPIRINARHCLNREIKINASISSQFISALLLIAPYCENGLHIELQGEIVSEPYVIMTLNLMQQLGVESKIEGNKIRIEASEYSSCAPIIVESDWSSAAFFYQYFACSRLNTIELSRLQLDSIQGDSRLARIYLDFGVKTVETESGVVLIKELNKNKHLELNLIDTPDLIPSIAVASSILKEKVIIHGTKTLKIKESNRIEALHIELRKIGAELVELTDNSIQIIGSHSLPRKVKFSSYNDHRIVMSLAMLKELIPDVSFDDITPVSKSFPNFWLEIQKVGLFS